MLRMSTMLWWWRMMASMWLRIRSRSIITSRWIIWWSTCTMRSLWGIVWRWWLICWWWIMWVWIRRWSKRWHSLIAWILSTRSRLRTKLSAWRWHSRLWCICCRNRRRWIMCWRRLKYWWRHCCTLLCSSWWIWIWITRWNGCSRCNRWRKIMLISWVIIRVLKGRMRSWSWNITTFCRWLFNFLFLNFFSNWLSSACRRTRIRFWRSCAFLIWYIRGRRLFNWSFWFVGFIFFSCWICLFSFVCIMI